MQKYRCHKEVEAFRIARILSGDELVQNKDPDLVREMDGPIVILAGAEGLPQVCVSERFLEKHKPGVGGYFVRYADGYESFSPAETFEAGYTAIPA